ncbi:MAG: indolepyruvate ferredoxin oxidoreductase beta subunit [Dinoroseobacter sp.]|jgi:indolepyruvate ferredoxin oxidoreductase beta subunit
MSNSQAQTTNIVIAALGGEGGGTLVSWIEDVAYNAGWYTQATSIAGVAQRTGATIYYLELFPGRDASKPSPILSMFPAASDIDIAISSEIAEAGRLIQRGFCTKDKTTLIASNHHVFGITEKIKLGDGGIDSNEIAKVAQQQCKKLVSFDMQELAEKNNTVISASLFGALSGSKALPFTKSQFEAVISASGKMVDNNLAAFNASYNKAIAPSLSVESVSPKAVQNKVASKVTKPFSLPTATTQHGAQLLSQIEKQFPTSCHYFLYLGVEKLLDYQDRAYALQYLDQIRAIHELDDGDQDYLLTNETARHLALWMSYEDTARVAQIKTRGARQEKIRVEVKADSDQIFHVTEFFAPRLEELCQPLPAGMARRILASPTCRKLASPFTKGKRLRTDTIVSFTLLRMMAFTRKWRRISFAYQDEHKLINTWLEQIKTYANKDSKAAVEVAKCARIVKGYGKTRERGTKQISEILELCYSLRLSASDISSLVCAALEDDVGEAFDQRASEFQR